MIDVQEHFYDDDPAKGHPDVRTRLKDVSYFFLGNGFIQAAVQIAPSGEGTPLGLLIMNPEYLGKKREAFTLDPSSGLEDTMVFLDSETPVQTAKAGTLKAFWFSEYKIPAVQVQWKTANFLVKELFYCPELHQPVLIREVRIKNLMQSLSRMRFKTGLLQEFIGQELTLSPGEKKRVFLQYTLDDSGKNVALDFVPGVEINSDAREYWVKKARASFGSKILDHYFKASLFQLPAVVSNSGKVDGSIWQYNREWVRDQAMMTVGLTVSGHHEIALKMLNRLLKEFVTEEGDTIDSSEKRATDEVELDQNGVLLYALKNYVLWTGDHEVISDNWDKIEATAEFPLKSVFRHSPSGLLANRREYWERHRVHGIEKGMELTHQMFASIGLSSAAVLAHMTSHDSKALRWEEEARRIKKAMLNDSQYGLIEEDAFIKRRSIDGSVQESINPLPEAQLPRGVPLFEEGVHLLNPDASAALPIALEFVSPDSTSASRTLENLEVLWNQLWEEGGYGRYHTSSEPDSPGAWPFPSLFIARAYVERGDFENAWRILRWMNTISGSLSGSWFEFYGQRLSPPYPQVGVTPWTWAEMLILLIHHIIGVQPKQDYLRIRPKLLPGVKKIQASFPLRGSKISLEIKRSEQEKSYGFHSNTTIIDSSEREACISYSEKGLRVEAIIP